MKKELIVRWKVRENAIADILKLLPTLVDQSKNEKGNLLYTIYQSESDPTALILHERYENDHALEIHKNSAYYQQLVVKQIIPHLVNREILFVNKLF